MSWIFSWMVCEGGGLPSPHPCQQSPCLLYPDLLLAPCTHTQPHISFFYALFLLPFSFFPFSHILMAVVPYYAAYPRQREAAGGVTEQHLQGEHVGAVEAMVFHVHAFPPGKRGEFVYPNCPDAQKTTRKGDILFTMDSGAMPGPVNSDALLLPSIGTQSKMCVTNNFNNMPGRLGVSVAGVADQGHGLGDSGAMPISMATSGYVEIQWNNSFEPAVDDTVLAEPPTQACVGGTYHYIDDRGDLLLASTTTVSRKLQYGLDAGYDPTENPDQMSKEVFRLWTDPSDECAFNTAMKLVESKDDKDDATALLSSLRPASGPDCAEFFDTIEGSKNYARDELRTIHEYLYSGYLFKDQNTGLAYRTVGEFLRSVEQIFREHFIVFARNTSTIHDLHNEVAFDHYAQKLIATLNAMISDAENNESVAALGKGTMFMIVANVACRYQKKVYGRLLELFKRYALGKVVAPMNRKTRMVKIRLLTRDQYTS